ncbi:helix-turn-helix domain-containing protein [Sphingobacterium paludis]|uniref:DNA-binding XRE family transcriptional regulator n=1 Tax=Sphingobacterium paludis TaxID=1476465 RepID=A0A4R7D6W1_9SPHI|nr:helix-turn-helix transcriptional regulator [Sphingobacterium paludis]TDS14716.1 DNA-binding XRE family transcriptional regulator [Sphingobacterium paludis]
MKIGNTIKGLRKSQGLNQSELSEKAGITQTALSQIEGNKKFPSQNTLEAISAALGVTNAAIYIMSATVDDVPAENRETFKKVYPSLKNMLEELFIS